MKKVEVGSKWVAKADLPEFASILKGTVVTVEYLTHDGIDYSADGEPDITWYACPKLWYEHFEPYVETVKAIEVGSKWVAKENYPLSAEVYKGDVVVIKHFRHDNQILYSGPNTDNVWYSNVGVWHDHFKPFGEDVKIDITKVEDSSPNYFDYPDIDDGQYTLGDPPPKDNVNSPSHYGQGSIEAIDYIKDSLTKEEYIGYLRGNIAKYLHRWRYKNGLEDLKKARWYLERLILEVE